MFSCNSCQHWWVGMCIVWRDFVIQHVCQIVARVRCVFIDTIFGVCQESEEDSNLYRSFIKTVDRSRTPGTQTVTGDDTRVIQYDRNTKRICFKLTFNNLFDRKGRTRASKTKVKPVLNCCFHIGGIDYWNVFSLNRNQRSAYCLHLVELFRQHVCWKKNLKCFRPSEFFWWSYFWPEYKCPYQCLNIHSTHLIWSREIFFNLESKYLEWISPLSHFITFRRCNVSLVKK
jgi:hypothetical protein